MINLEIETWLPPQQHHLGRFATFLELSLGLHGA
jgi:hypothetical protein